MRNAASNGNIVLVGPMGSGKSHVGRLLATRLGLGFADVDAGVEAGAVLDPGSRAAIRAAGRVVYLQVGAAQQLQRIAGDRGRPLLAVADPAARLAELQALREPLYRGLADLAFDTSTLSPEQVAEALAALLADHMEAHA